MQMLVEQSDLLQVYVFFELWRKLHQCKNLI